MMILDANTDLNIADIGKLQDCSSQLPVLSGLEAKMIFTYLNGWKEKSKECYFENYIKFKCSYSKVVYQNTVYDCFLATMAELSSCNQDYIASKALSICSLALERKNVQTPDLLDGMKNTENSKYGRKYKKYLFSFSILFKRLKQK